MNEFFTSLFGSAPSQIMSTLPGLFASFSLETILKSVGLYLLIVWIAFVVWIVRDISNRTSSILLQTFCILVIVLFTPIFGLPIYLLIRPKSTLFEQYYEELEMAEAEYEESHRCHGCGGIVEAEYRYCPHCGEELLEPCKSCDKLVAKDYAFCPYCKQGRGEEETPKNSVPAKKEEKPVKKPKPKTEDIAVEKALSVEVEEKEEAIVPKEIKEIVEEKEEETPAPEVLPKKEKKHSIVAEEI